MVVLLWSLSPATAAAAGAESNVTPLPDPTVQTFDPNTPPGDLGAGEKADAKTTVSLSGTFSTGFNNQTKKFFVKDVDPVEVSGQTVIRQPNNADDDLKKHELGHHTLSKDEYDKRVAKKVADALSGFKGMMFMGAGNTFQERAADAEKQAQAEYDRRLKRAKEAIESQMKTLSAKYDSLTDHSKSPTVDTDKGVKEAIKERDRAPGAGSHLWRPDREKPFAAVSGPTLLYDPATDVLIFSGHLLFDTAADATDSILGTGEAVVGPIIAIGPQLNGTVHLSDTIFDVIDSTSGDVLLNAFLFELAYMPSSLPEFPGMIQGYLDIPPPFAAQGVSNTISSPFLDGLQQASLANEITSFWFYTNQPVFDAEGRPLLGKGGTTGELVAGVATPEPGTLALFGLGLFGFAVRRRRPASRTFCTSTQ
ncbi:MAG: PEP-CTERM sorting domain-containing protein [Candidatus Omnitrophica bacterium]|nr:PEP-CTERM sorting domain-containing protein [Candidatus Omnitrophota bacterium]